MIGLYDRRRRLSANTIVAAMIRSVVSVYLVPSCIVLAVLGVHRHALIHAPFALVFGVLVESVLKVALPWWYPLAVMSVLALGCYFVRRLAFDIALCVTATVSTLVYLGFHFGGFG